MTPGAADISSCHFGHSVLWITSETGDPSVSAVPDAAEELDVVALEPHPRAAPEAEAAPGQLVAISSIVMGRPAGSPSTTTARAGPCDSPAVR